MCIRDSCDIVLMQLETPMTTIEYVAAEAAKRSKRTVLNPAPGAALSPQLLKSLYLITPNETEAEIITGIRIHNAETEAEAARSIRAVSYTHLNYEKRGWHLFFNGCFF